MEKEVVKVFVVAGLLWIIFIIIVGLTTSESFQLIVGLSIIFWVSMGLETIDKAYRTNNPKLLRLYNWNFLKLFCKALLYGPYAYLLFTREGNIYG